MIKKIEIERFKRFSSSVIDVKQNALSVLVGGNNSGKSSLLQALAIWNYAKSVIIFYKSREALNSAGRRDGVGIGFDDFTPLNIPSFDYLWTNLASGGGYTLTIKLYWDDLEEREKFLEIGFALTQDRLFVKKTASNLDSQDLIPEIAYLPPFAGILEKEPWMSGADRRKQIGRGLSGSVLRNLILDFYAEYTSITAVKGRNKVERLEKEKKLEGCAFTAINKILGHVFSVNLYPDKFSPEFHNYLRVPLRKGSYLADKFVPYRGFEERDIMAEGRGFLQWLSTLCLLFDHKINVLLLDEPDAHLHATLQVELLKTLQEFIDVHGKQILVATHSSEVIKSISPNIILQIQGNKASYCNTESQIRTLLLGLGVEHFPLLHKIQTSKKVVFVEAEFDARILKDFAVRVGKAISPDIVFWAMANNHQERKQVFLHLSKEIPDLKVISLEDRDNFDYGGITADLSEKGQAKNLNGASVFLAKRWRRWELENYLLNPKAIAAAASQPEQEILEDFKTLLGIVWPTDFNVSERTQSNASLFDRAGKEMIEVFEDKYCFSKNQLPMHFEQSEVCDDIITFIDQMNQL